MIESKAMLENIEQLAEDELDRAVKDKKAELAGGSNGTVPKNTAEGHRSRLRERFIKSRLTGFHDYEILEMLLFYAIPRKDTKPIAKELISSFGSLSGVFGAGISELVKIKGVTENAAVLIKMIPSLFGTLSADMNRDCEIKGTKSLINMFRPYFSGERSEKLLMACFDEKLRLISVSEVSKGSFKATSVCLRRIITEALAKNCSMAALAHNHPRSSPKPSDSDIANTRMIIDYLSKVDIKLMDHVIIGADRCYSMRDGGDLGIFD